MATAVKDYVAEEQQHLKQQFADWYSEIPAQATDVATLRKHLEQGPTLCEMIEASGLSTRTVARQVSGQFDSPSGGVRTPRRTSTSSRRRTSRRRTSTTAAGGNGTITTDQLLAAIGAGTNQSLLAQKLGVSRATVAKHLARAQKDGLVTSRGTGQRKTWHPKLTAPLAA